MGYVPKSVEKAIALDTFRFAVEIRESKNNSKGDKVDDEKTKSSTLESEAQGARDSGNTKSGG